MPPTANQCGLIRKTDAERLTSYLSTSAAHGESTEGGKVEDSLSVSSPNCRKRRRNSSVSSLSSSPALLDGTVTPNAPAQEITERSAGEDCNLTIKRSKASPSDISSVSPNVSTQTAKPDPPAANECMEAIPPIPADKKVIDT